MQALRHWSLTRIALLSIGWVVLCVLLAVAWFQVKVWGGGGEIGFMVVNVNVLTLAVPFAPPVALIAAWLASRWR